MKRINFQTLAGIVALATSWNVISQPLVESQFIVTESGPVGSVATHEKWNGTATNAYVTLGSGSLDGTGLGLVASKGDKVEIRGGDSPAHTHYCLFASSRQFPAGSGANLYFSFLYRFNSTVGLTSDGVVIASIIRQNSSSATNFAILARLAGTSIQLGVVKPNGAPAWSTLNIAPNQTVFVVARQQMLSGTANDQIDLWVNPPPTSFGKPEDAVPTPSASTTDGTEDTSSTGPGRFYLDIWPNANATFDEFRVGVSWADVTIPAGACEPASITSTSPDVTLSEGALTILSVTSTGTSPTHQWQESPDGGITWIDAIGGADALTRRYTTPLFLLSDNGKKYRCLAHVDCNNSWATSSVITITVTQAIKTPVGLVVDDRWDDYEFGDGAPNYPVTTNNAVWLYSSGVNRALDPVWDDQSQTWKYNLVLTPPADSSMLVISYFTDSNAPPVHLDVGKGLVTEFVFKASGIVESNGGLRLGLFDYADGATRVAANGFSGSTGNGANVVGFMVNIDFGKTFAVNSPISINRRRNIESGNLMGTLGDFVGIAAGPTGMAGAPAFQEGVFYTNRLTVARVSSNMVRITNSIIGGGTNWTVVGVETNFPFHRFDAFALRVASGNSSASQFVVSNLYVAVIDLPVEAPTPEPLRIEHQNNNIILRWTDPKFSLYTATNVLGPYTKIPNATSPFTLPIDAQTRFFRLIWTPQD